MKNEITYFAFYPGNWKSLNEYDILITRGDQGSEAEFKKYLNEFFIEKNIQWELCYFKIDSHYKFLDRLEKSKMTRGQNSGIYYIRKAVTPSIWVHFKEMEKIEDIVSNFIDKNIYKKSFFKRIFKISA